MATAIRSTALRAGGACVRCRKGKTKCVYENGRAPCKNCAKGMHECYLPSESMSHGGHGVSPARVPQRSRESLPSERAVGVAGERQAQAASAASRHVSSTAEKLTPELMQECERVIAKTIPACVAFHKPSFLQQLKNTMLDTTMVNALLTTAARHSPSMIRRYGGHGGPTAAAEHFATKTINLIMSALDHPSLADIQSLCLLVIHEWGSRNAVRAYVYLGQAARMAQMYRVVHTNHQQSDPERFLHDESLRRTLWLIYILDCFLTSSPGRHPALSSLDVDDVALPCPDMNYNFGSPAFTRTLKGTAPSSAPDPNMLSDVGEFGHIVLATKAWRNVVEMMTTRTLETFSEEECLVLEGEIEAIRQSLPAHFADKPGQLNLHITMGSGFTYAMIHCLLHCATIFVNRRRILQLVTAENFSQEGWRLSPHNHMPTVDRIFASSHTIIAMLTALEHGADKDSILCFPIFMLFSAFTAGSTVAYLALKGLAPPNASETASHIVRDSLRFMHDGAESWPLVIPWNRHLTVMAKVLREVNSRGERSVSRDELKYQPQPSPPSVKDDNGSQPDTSVDAMDYDQPPSAGPPPPAPAAPMESRGSEPPVPRRPGVTTINGGSADVSTPATGTPPPSNNGGKVESPNPSPPSSVTGVPVAPIPQPSAEVDMTASELCAAFERQLLELDDLAAFMGGGV
ncbi:Nitrogen assimilation transcription factor nit-4 [Pleurostoma richardsiae]|uniref:Nitrogen assimilation transcription factor nit-4 n=1 Tax=Pleurostoma richardsiae TaxID=41990 RepID=A0AA38RPH2_9PEZI|nr:Nitrogen assimilation transcription factor nit-4 [Pleurostoma richardsiae]